MLRRLRRSQPRIRSPQCRRVFASGFFRDWDSAGPVDDIVRFWMQSAEPPELGALTSHFLQMRPAVQCHSHRRLRHQLSRVDCRPHVGFCVLLTPSARRRNPSVHLRNSAIEFILRHLGLKPLRTPQPSVSLFTVHYYQAQQLRPRAAPASLATSSS